MEDTTIITNTASDEAGSTPQVETVESAVAATVTKKPRKVNTVNIKTLLNTAAQKLGDDDLAKSLVAFITDPESVDDNTSALLKAAIVKATRPVSTSTGTRGPRPTHDVTAPAVDGAKLCQLYQVEVIGPFLVGRNYALKKGWVVRDTRSNTDDVFLTAGNKNARAEAKAKAEESTKRLKKAAREELAVAAAARTTVDPQSKGMVIGR